MNYFFIDYENVHYNGFSGIENYEKDDVICLMYTDVCKNIPLNVLYQLIHNRELKLEIIKVGAGSKNALDFQLSAYLGYVIAKNEGQKCGYYIVSKDTGFNSVISFWNSRGISVKRIPDFAALKQPVQQNNAPKNSNNKQNNKNDMKADEQKQQLKKTAAAAAQVSEEPAEVKSAKVQEAKSKAASKEQSKPKKVTKQELLKCIDEEEYTDKLLEIINKYKTKVSINRALDKEYRDSQKSSAIYKKLKSFLKSIGKN